MKLKVSQSCLTLCNPMDYTVHGILQVRILERVAFPVSRRSSQPRDWNPGLLHCRWILYQLSHKGSPRILGWVGYPFSSGSSGPRNRTGVSFIAGGSFTNWAIIDWMVIPPKGKYLPQPPEPMNAALFVKMFFGDMIQWKHLRWDPSCISRRVLSPICCCCLVAE